MNHCTILACKKGTKKCKSCDKIAKIGQNFAFLCKKKAQWLTTSVRQNTWNKELLAMQVQLSSTPPVTCLTQPLNPNAHTAACSYGRRLRRKHWIFCAQHIVSRARGVRCPLCSAHNRGDGHRLVEPHVCTRQSMIQVNTNSDDGHTAAASVSDIYI